jgi:hypothetical protein
LICVKSATAITAAANRSMNSDAGPVAFDRPPSSFGDFRVTMDSSPAAATAADGMAPGTVILLGLQ